MQKTVFISLPIEDLQTVIIDCVNSCLKNNKHSSTQHPPETDQLLTIQEAADFLSLTVATLYSKVSKDELPVMKRSIHIPVKGSHPFRLKVGHQY